MLLEANGQIGAEVVAQAALVPPIIFAYLGQNLLGIVLRPALPAAATATFTFAADVQPVTIPAASELAVPHPDGNSYLFGTDGDVVAPAGGGTVTVGITALEPGAAANGAYGTCELINVVDGLDTVTVADPAGGGADEESEDDYLDRLADAMTILAPRPILPVDHAVMARQVQGVGRALALDLYIPGASENPVGDTDAPEYTGVAQTGVPRATTVAVTADDGTAPSLQLKQQVFQTLDAAREVNFLNYVIAPTYTTISVKATVTAYAGYAPADVQAACEASLANWLNPALWGASPAAAVSGSEDWTTDTKARLYEAVDYLNRADGCYFVNTVQLSSDGGQTWVNTDIDLTGAAPLPLPGVLNITVNLPQ